MFDIPISDYLAFQRHLIYVGLFTAWGVSVRRRIIQAQVRRYLIAISALMVFWLLVRYSKYGTENLDLTRHLWYSYYIAMLLIPALCVLVALSLGKPEKYRLPRKWVGIVMVPTVLLILLVQTNDLHQLAFAFSGEVWTDKNSTYQIVYWLVAAWMLLTALATLCILIARSRVLRGRKILWQPFVPLALSVLYTVLYITALPMVRLFARDMSIVFCLLFTAMLESCIRCGLIQSNTRYAELFHASTLGAGIIDKDGRPLLSSVNAVSVEREKLMGVRSSPALLPDGIRLSGAPIRGGRHVVWQEDISELLDVVAQIEDSYEFLRGENTVLTEEYRTRKKRQALVEKNRLYNMVQTQTERQLAQIDKLTDSLSRAATPEEASRIVAHIAVAVAYVKRRNNLIFISEESGTVAACELEYCLKESLSNLKLAGVTCELRTELTDPLPFEQVAFLYDRFESIVEAAIDTLKKLYISAFMEGETPAVTLMVSCAENLSSFAGEGCSVTRDEETVWIITCAAPPVGKPREEGANA